MLAHNIHEQGGIIIIVVVTGRSDDLRNRAKRDTMGKCALESCIFTKGQLISKYLFGAFNSFKKQTKEFDITLGLIFG